GSTRPSKRSGCGEPGTNLGHEVLGLERATRFQMSNLRDGMNWAPEVEKPKPVVQPGQFAFASAFFEHGHIYGQTNGLIEAGGQCKWAWDPDPIKLEKFCQTYPGVRAARSYQ